MNTMEKTNIKNYLQDHMQAVGMGQMRPAADTLRSMRITPRRWGKLVRNTGNEARQSEIIAINKYMSVLFNREINILEKP
jgi:hypothetical protein